MSQNHTFEGRTIENRLTYSFAAMRFIVYSLFGLFMFFYPLTVGSVSSIPVDHIITFIRNYFPKFATIYAIAVMIAGAALPFVRKTWNRSKSDIFFSLAKVMGAFIGPMIFFNVGPSFLLEKSIGPFLLSSLAVPVSLVIPIGSVFLAFLTGYGLLEFTGVFIAPVMRALFKTPGRSAIDAIASFAGSYSVGLIITNNLYRRSLYSVREAAIIATGFSTVSATFMLVVAKTLKIMDYWILFFVVSMIVTFVVTAITARLWPLSAIPDSYYDGSSMRTKEERGGFSFKHAWQAGVITAMEAPSIGQTIKDNFNEGLNMAFAVIPSIISIGFLGLMTAKYTPIFDMVGYIYYPLFKLFNIPEAMLAAKACAVSLAEMFLPAILVANADIDPGLVFRFTIAVISISEVLFFSGIIPCIMGTDIPLKIKDLIVIWFERVVLSILVTIPIAMLLF
ncbi:YjiH family protein [Acetomicrobium sp.]|uniref:YjiH family protein n=1 Tax=Acetomicrobium sp. TaxID=1872099 RepID=UPI001BCF3BE5|nr:YjiH family protein [Acetomicrobium sp.]